MLVKQRASLDLWPCRHVRSRSHRTSSTSSARSTEGLGPGAAGAATNLGVRFPRPAAPAQPMRPYARFPFRAGNPIANFANDAVLSLRLRRFSMTTTAWEAALIDISGRPTIGRTGAAISRCLPRRWPRRAERRAHGWGDLPMSACWRKARPAWSRSPRTSFDLARSRAGSSAAILFAHPVPAVSVRTSVHWRRLIDMQRVSWRWCSTRLRTVTWRSTVNACSRGTPRSFRRAARDLPGSASAVGETTRKGPCKSSPIRLVGSASIIKRRLPNTLTLKWIACSTAPTVAPTDYCSFAQLWPICGSSPSIPSTTATTGSPVPSATCSWRERTPAPGTSTAFPQIQRERNACYDILEKTRKGTMHVTAWLTWLLYALTRAGHGSGTGVGWRRLGQVTVLAALGRNTLECEANETPQSLA